MKSDTAPRSRPSKAARSGFRERVERVKRRELEEALTKLESRGDLSPEQRAVIAELAERLAERLVADPAATLHQASGTTELDPDTVRQLFEPDDERD